jgi:hypothetical protein
MIGTGDRPFASPARSSVGISAVKSLTLAFSASLMIHSHHQCDEINAHPNMRDQNILTYHRDLLSGLKNYGVEPRRELLKVKGRVVLAQRFEDRTTFRAPWRGETAVQPL